MPKTHLDYSKVESELRNCLRLNNLPESLQTAIKNTTNWNSASLMSENLNSLSFASQFWTNNKVSIRENSIPEPGSSKKIISVQSGIGTGLGTFKISTF